MQTEVKMVSSEKLFYMMQKTGFLMVIANTESQSLGNTVDTKKGKLWGYLHPESQMVMASFKASLCSHW